MLYTVSCLSPYLLKIFFNFIGYSHVFHKLRGSLLQFLYRFTVSKILVVTIPFIYKCKSVPTNLCYKDPVWNRSVKFKLIWKTRSLKYESLDGILYVQLVGIVFLDFKFHKVLNFEKLMAVLWVPFTSNLIKSKT